MRFFDIDKIQRNSGISNKYLLTSVVAMRARKLSEDKGSVPLDEKGRGEKFISTALAELENDSLSITFDIPGIDGGECRDELGIEED
nr:DNA-directed RNA polymerase subunit omega [uncultured Dethiosulfovibrio sp.]